MGKTIKLQNDTYIANEIYSTDEKIIGTWLGKTLYRKCIYIPNYPNTSQITITTGILNATVINLYGYSSNGAESVPINYNNTLYGGSIYCYSAGAGSNLQLGASFNANPYSGYITLEYTKN